ncbi:MAG: hypothetical protein P1U56_11375 [Saprospiraceae bacterium]|nr:hypothetical protein [Saprospiraceae bacterium]
MKNLILYIALVIPFTSWSQDTLITESDTIITNTGVIEVDQVEVIKAFEANLMDAKKVFLRPSIKPTIPVEKTYNYDITIVPLNIEYPDPVIRPLAMNPDPPKPVKKFYSRLGYGDLNSPYADISFHNQKGDEYDYTVSGHYYGADDSEVVDFRKFYESELNINFGYRLGENHKLTADLQGGYDRRNLYDTTIINGPDPIEGLDIERNIIKTQAAIGIQNIERTDANFNYGFKLTGQRIKLDGLLDSDEAGIGLNIFVDNKLSSFLSLYVKGDGSLHTISLSTGGSNDRNAFSANPGLQLSLGNFMLDAAADIFVDDFQTSPFVDIKASYSLMDNNLQIYAGANQVAIANTLWNHYLNNPFVSSFIPIRKTTLSKQFFGGISGKMKDFITFNFMGGYADIKDQFYYDDVADFRLWVRHTDMTNVFINANIEFNLTKNVSLGANVSQNFFSPEEIDRLPNTPEYKYSGYSKVRLLDNRIVFSADLNLMDKISYIDNFGNELLGNSQIDLSLGVDINMTDNVGIWLRANNLLDREYLRFSNYPEFGRNILGGLLFKF